MSEEKVAPLFSVAAVVVRYFFRFTLGIRSRTDRFHVRPHQ